MDEQLKSLVLDMLEWMGPEPRPYTAESGRVKRRGHAFGARNPLSPLAGRGLG